MGLKRTFKGRAVRRTQRVGRDHILVIFDGGRKGQPNPRQVLRYEEYEKHVQKNYTAPVS